MVQQTAPARTALSWPMVSALESRSPARARHLATSPQHLFSTSFSRVCFSVLRPAAHHPGSSLACRMTSLPMRRSHWLEHMPQTS
eukprot:4525231-Prymnesium_polylepis.1